MSFLNRTARNAIENQEEIQDQQVFISVKTAIEERVLDLALSSKEKPVTLPKVSFFRSGVLRIRNYLLRIRNYFADPELFVADPELSIADPELFFRDPDPDLFKKYHYYETTDKSDHFYL